MFTVKAFKYLGWFLTAYDDEWPEVVVNLQKDMSRWASLFRILRREGHTPGPPALFTRQ